MSEVSTEASVEEGLADEESADEVDDAPRARPSLGPVVALGLAAALMIGALAVALIGGDDVSPTAITVNGDRTTSATLDSELEGFSTSVFFQRVFAEQQAPVAFSGDGWINAFGTMRWLQFRTQSDLLQTMLERRGVPLTQAQINEMAQELASDDITTGMSEAAANEVAVNQAADEQLSKQFQTEAGYRSAVRRAARKLHVTVDPKYGRYDAKSLSFCSSLGCEAGSISLVPSPQ